MVELECWGGMELAQGDDILAQEDGRQAQQEGGRLALDFGGLEEK